VSPYQKAGRWFTRVTLPDGRARVVSMGTTDKVTARAIDRMVDTLAERRQWAALTAIVEKRTTLPLVYDAYELGSLDAFLRRLTDPDLDGLVTEWATSARSAKYVLQVRRMIPEGQRYPASDFTRKAVSAFLAGLKVSGSTRNRYRAALSVFARWLVEREVLETNPVRDVRGHKENAPRDRWLSTEQAQAVCDAAGGLYRGLFAVLYGAGVEVSAALRIMPRDVDGLTIHIRGTKTAWRNRVVVIPAWTAERMRVALHVMPSVPVFAGISYMDAYRAHRDALSALKLDGYTMHDARHSYAVNALRSGLRPEVVARQLGHRDATLVLKVYGKYVPDASDYEPKIARSATRGATSRKRRIP
jgi:integrase